MQKLVYEIVDIVPRIWAYRACLRQEVTVRYRWLRAPDLNLCSIGNSVEAGCCSIAGAGRGV